MENGKSVDNSIVHVVNIGIQDNLEEATIGTFLIKDLWTTFTKSDDIYNDIKEILQVPLLLNKLLCLLLC